MRVDDFDFNLPNDFIALRPCDIRHEAKMLVVKDGVIKDSFIEHFFNFLKDDDCIVFNDTKVFKARLLGKIITKNRSAIIEVTLHKFHAENTWFAFAKNSKKLRVGDLLFFEKDNIHLKAKVLQKTIDSGEVLLEFYLDKNENFFTLIDKIGIMPLPPYIAAKRAVDSLDDDDYQSLFATHIGSVAAPTASLHFDDYMMCELKKRNIQICYITLHVGAGTFLPVKAEDTQNHKMHAEIYHVSEKSAKILNETKAKKGRIIAIGTTALRTLETICDSDDKFYAKQGETTIFITPGYNFKAVDVLMTNFHLPRSTLFMLVSAFCGLEVMKSAYEYAIKNSYRFYSYGDANLLFRHKN
jgi:S-adenosylmethionine:tRNA ribosyltransferase-isomerase